MDKSDKKSSDEQLQNQAMANPAAFLDAASLLGNIPFSPSCNINLLFYIYHSILGQWQRVHVSLFQQQHGNDESQCRWLESSKYEFK